MNPGKDFIGIGVGAVILNEAKEILLLYRKREPENGYWSIPGGKVEFFDTLEKTIVREVIEELGVNIKVIRLLGVTDHIIELEGSHWVAPVYLAEITSGFPRNMEPEKHGELKWFNLNNLPKNLSITAAKAIEYLERNFQNDKI